MPASLAAAVVAKSTSSPWKRKMPASRWWTPATILTSVDLPAPFSPTRAWMEPGSTARVPARRATTEPNDLATSRSSSVGVTGVSDMQFHP